MTTKDKGDISEAFVIARCLAKGWEVYKPLKDNNRCDLLVCKDGKTYERVQIKTGRLKNGAIIIPVCSVGYLIENGKAVYNIQDYKDRIDAFAAYCPLNDKTYYFPITEHNRSISLRIDPTKNNQTRNIFWAKDFEI
jgi:hypothetical protein